MSQKNTKNTPSGGKGAQKGKKSAAGGKKVEDEREETLQAVVWNCILDMIRQSRKLLIFLRYLRIHSRHDLILSH
jgi:hypothetical protein